MTAPAAQPLPQPETVEDWYARVAATVGTDGRLPTPVDGASGWEIFPYEPDSLVVKKLEEPTALEPPRRGEDRSQCWCATGEPWAPVWRNERWVLNAAPSELPFHGSLCPLAHHDLTDLPLDLAAEMGQLVVVLGAAVEALPSCGRVHMSKWGDGGAHLHLQFLARPARMSQLRGSCLPDWIEHFPVLPDDVATANIAAVVRHVTIAVGGEALGRGAGVIGG